MRQSIRGYTDAVIEQCAGAGSLSEVASELSAVANLVDISDDLRGVLTDPGVPAPARRAVVTDLLQDKVSAPTLRLVTYAVTEDRATEFRDDLAWLATRIDAAAGGRAPIGGPVLGHLAASERVDGYATGVLEELENTRALGDLEEELFRFRQVIKGSEELSAALSSRDVAPSARRALVEDLLRSGAAAATVRLAAYATEVGRPRDYEDLLVHLVERVAAESDRRVADVRAPIDLDEEQRRHLGEALARVAGHPVEVRVTVDRAVLGGFVATIGDTVVDGSTRHRLNILKERLDMPEAEITTGERS